MNYYEVFIPWGVPTYTYNPRDTYDLEERINRAKKRICKLMIVTGQTKMGKTVLTEKVYDRNDNNIPLIVDDFHYIERNVQTSIVRALKSPIMHGLPVIFIAIPSRKFEVIKVEREMTGRIEMFEIPSWTVDELMEIANKGFKELNVDVPYNIKLTIARVAMGSPHLMQEFCKELCIKNRIEEIPQLHEVSRVLEKIAEISYNDGVSTPVIDWDKEEAILTITDSFFAFYLRWSDAKD